MLALNLLASDYLISPGEGLLKESRRAKHLVRDAQLQYLFGLEHAILLKWVFQNYLQGVANTDQVWEQIRATPAWNQANEDLWECDGRSGLVNGSVVCIESYLEATA